TWAVSCDPPIPDPLSYGAQSPGSRQPADRAGGSSGLSNGSRGTARTARWAAQLLSSRGCLTPRRILTKRDVRRSGRPGVPVGLHEETIRITTLYGTTEIRHC